MVSSAIHAFVRSRTKKSAVSLACGCHEFLSDPNAQGRLHQRFGKSTKNPSHDSVFENSDQSTAAQHRLALEPPEPNVPPPPLEMVPLIISGPSTNRVDLVFFSDGCELTCCIQRESSRNSWRSSRRAWKIRQWRLETCRGCFEEPNVSHCPTTPELLGGVFA